MNRFIKDIKKFYKYVTYSAKSGLKSEVAGSHLGWIWWILEPVMFMLVYWFIFSVVMSGSVENMPIYIFIGLSIWNFFNKGLTDSVKIVNSNVSILSKVYVPKYMLILSNMFKLAFKMLVSFGIVVIMMIICRVHVTWYALWIIPIIITLFLVCFGLNCIIAHFGVFVEDLKNVTNIVLRVIFYMSGVFYELIPRNGKASKIPEPFVTILSKCNPMAFLMTSARECLIYSSNVGYKVLACWFAMGVVLSVVGVKVIYKYENSYIKVM